MLKNKIGIDVATWKAETQTEQDWQEDGLLWLQSEINRIKRATNEQQLSAAEAQVQLDSLSQQLSGVIAQIRGTDREFELTLTATNKAIDSSASLRSNLVEDTSEIAARISKLEDALSRLIFKVSEEDKSSADAHDRAALKDKMVQSFSETELREICFDSGIDFEIIAGSEKVSKVMELIMFSERRAELDALKQLCRGRRPKVDW